ncbi:SANT/Myb-like DNA-binding domain-containing protein [Streptomyces sp. NPDC001606]
MADVPRGKVRLRFTDFVVDPQDPDIMRRTMDVEADVITFDAQSVCLWLQGVEVKSLPLSSLAAIELPQGDSTALSKAYSVEKIRTHHANAYQRWTPEDEQLLLKLHSEGHDPESLARRFQRQPSAIRARLEKLGAETTETTEHQAGPPF